jgi:hypothetical protein
MTFKLRVDKQTEILKRRETLSAELCGYDVIVSTDEHSTHLSIAPVYWQDGLRMGIINCYPKSVAELEKFAEVAGDLFRAIAKELREAGKDDLRTEHEKRMDEMQARFRTVMNEAKQ